MRIRPRGLALGQVSISPALTARIALGAFGAWVASIGIRALLRGHPFAANAPVGRWLVGGVLAHDAVIAPTVFVLGAVSARLAGPRVRQALAAILLIGGSVVIVGLPDALRKGHSSNPTVTPLDYTRNLVIVLTAVVGGVVLTNTATALRQRRHVRKASEPVSTPAPTSPPASTSAPQASTTDADTTGYFHVRRLADRWTLVSPQGRRFVNIGIAHAEPREGLVRDLTEWGYTAIGGTEDYAATDMPYCIPLRPLEIESWNDHPTYRDPTSAAFDEYCEYLARAICLPHAEDPNLIGYFLIDGPCWDVHPTGAQFAALSDLDAPSRAAALGDLAAAYYETVARHIRRQDPNHLILGDRYSVKAGIPEPVLHAMRDHVDVLSVQTATAADEQQLAEELELLDRCHELTGKPILIADTGDWCATEPDPQRERASDIPDEASRAQHYIRTLTALIERPWCLGWIWHGNVDAATSFNHRVRAELRHDEPI